METETKQGEYLYGRGKTDSVEKLKLISFYRGNRYLRTNNTIIRRGSSIDFCDSTPIILDGVCDMVYDIYKWSEDYIKNKVKNQIIALTPDADSLCFLDPSARVCSHCGSWSISNGDKKFMDAKMILFTGHYNDELPPKKINMALKTLGDFEKYQKPPEVVNECHCCKRFDEVLKAQLKSSEIEQKRSDASKIIERQLASEPEDTRTKKVHAKPEKRSLYIMKCERTGFYKIGVSVSPKHRESTLQAQEPTINLVGKWAGLGYRESEWHHHFANQRLRGEWFALTKTQVAFFCKSNTSHAENDSMALAAL